MENPCRPGTTQTMLLAGMVFHASYNPGTNDESLMNDIDIVNNKLC